MTSGCVCASSLDCLLAHRACFPLTDTNVLCTPAAWLIKPTSPLFPLLRAEASPEGEVQQGQGGRQQQKAQKGEAAEREKTQEGEEAQEGTREGQQAQPQQEPQPRQERQAAGTQPLPGPQGLTCCRAWGSVRWDRTLAVAAWQWQEWTGETAGKAQGLCVTFWLGVNS